MWKLTFSLSLFLLFLPTGEARRIVERKELFFFVQENLIQLGYSAREAVEIAQSLKKLIPELGELSFVSDEFRKAQRLGELIKSKVGYAEMTYQLSQVAQRIQRGERPRVNCLGYVQLVYALGKAVGLEVRAIEVYSWHIANLIHLSSGEVILDLGEERDGFYLSPVFQWKELYREEGKIEVLKQNAGFDQTYKFVQRLDSKGIRSAIFRERGNDEAKSARSKWREGNISQALLLYQQGLGYLNQALSINPDAGMTYNELGAIRSDQAQIAFSRENFEEAFNFFQEAVRDFTFAIEINPYYAIAYLNRGLIRFKFGEVEIGLEDIRRALQLKPELIKVIPPGIKNAL